MEILLLSRIICPKIKDNDEWPLSKFETDSLNNVLHSVIVNNNGVSHIHPLTKLLLSP